MYAVELLLPYREVIAHYPSLQAAIDSTRKYWNEEPGPQLFVVTHKGEIEAALTRGIDQSDCLTTYRDGTTEAHSISYIVDEKGTYEYTEVTKL